MNKRQVQGTHLHPRLLLLGCLLAPQGYSLLHALALQHFAH